MADKLSTTSRRFSKQEDVSPGQRITEQGRLKPRYIDRIHSFTLGWVPERHPPAE